MPGPVRPGPAWDEAADASGPRARRLVLVLVLVLVLCWSGAVLVQCRRSTAC